MTVDDLIAYGKGRVHSDLAKMLLAELLEVNALELFMILDKEVDNDIVEKYKMQVNELKEGKPIQYVIGNVNFYGLRFNVDERVLIPRFETEQLVEETIKRIKNKYDDKNVSIIDLGCGSGAIGLTLKNAIPNSFVTLLDISLDAIDVAKENANNLGLEVNFKHNDMLDGINEKYDVIISNPPYIKTNEEIEDIVRFNEPHKALFGGVDGLDLYREILKNIKNNLKEEYIIAFEIGDTLKDDITNLIKEVLPDSKIECLKDLNNRDRMIFVENE